MENGPSLDLFGFRGCLSFGFVSGAKSARAVLEGSSSSEEELESEEYGSNVKVTCRPSLFGRSVVPDRFRGMKELRALGCGRSVADLPSMGL